MASISEVTPKVGEPDVYQRLISKEERVLQGLNRFAEEEVKRRRRRDHILDRPLTILWYDMNMYIVKLLGRRDWTRAWHSALLQDPDGQMYLGMAVALVATVAVLATALTSSGW
jgi:hypothetical protein